MNVDRSFLNRKVGYLDINSGRQREEKGRKEICRRELEDNFY